MDFFFDLFMNFLRRHSFGAMDFHWRDQNLLGLIKKIVEHERKSFGFGTNKGE